MPYSTLLLLFLQWRGQRMNFICFWRHCSWFYPRWHLCSFYHFSKERSARHISYIFSYFNKGEIYSFNYLFDGISADLRSNITSHIFWDIDSYLSGYLTKWKNINKFYYCQKLYIYIYGHLQNVWRDQRIHFWGLCGSYTSLRDAALLKNQTKTSQRAWWIYQVPWIFEILQNHHERRRLSQFLLRYNHSISQANLM